MATNEHSWVNHEIMEWIDKKFPVPEHLEPEKKGNWHAYGDVKFVNQSKSKAKYIRIHWPKPGSSENYNNQKEKEQIINNVCELLIKIWELPRPTLIIAIIGGAIYYNGLMIQQYRFRRALVRTAKSTGAWIITDGTFVGVSKQVDRGIRDYFAYKNSTDRVVCIGIAPFGLIMDNEKLIRKNAGSLTEKENTQESSLRGSVKYFIPKRENYTNVIKQYLAPYHTHFLLIDDGTEGQFVPELSIRNMLENCLIKKYHSKICYLVVNGGIGALNSIDQVVEQNADAANAPIILVGHTGRVADLLSMVFQSSCAEILEILEIC